MTVEEAGRLLVIIADFEPTYKPSKGTAKSWQRVLGNMSFTDAERYFYEHFQNSKYVPKPAEILDRARAAFDPDKTIPMELPDDMRGGLPNAQ